MAKAPLLQGETSKARPCGGMKGSWSPPHRQSLTLTQSTALRRRQWRRRRGWVSSAWATAALGRRVEPAAPQRDTSRGSEPASTRSSPPSASSPPVRRWPCLRSVTRGTAQPFRRHHPPPLHRNLVFKATSFRGRGPRCVLCTQKTHVTVLAWAVFKAAGRQYVQHGCTSPASPKYLAGMSSCCAEVAANLTAEFMDQEAADHPEAPLQEASLHMHQVPLSNAADLFDFCVYSGLNALFTLGFFIRNLY